MTESISSSLTITLEAARTISYASAQNHIPLLNRLTVTNNSEQAIGAFDIVLRSDPEFMEPKRIRFELLAAGESKALDLIDVRLKHSFLANLDEAVSGRIQAVATQGEQLLSECSKDIDVLAYDQWPGLRGLPELLAAFVMPNNSAIDVLLRQASEELRRANVSDNLTGYEAKNRENVWVQISAIYSAVARQRLAYALPPASFCHDGQKVRTPDRILSAKLATCLDSALLLAAAFEQAGLHSLVLLSESHAWVGCWLLQSTFATPVIEDAQSIRKRIRGGELVVIESTCLSQDHIPSLRIAAEQGALLLDDDAAFRVAIDVRKARQHQILPLPSRAQTQLANSALDAEITAPQIELNVSLPPLADEAITIEEEELPKTPEDRLSRWKNKLLDLTLRNRLLNFKPTKSTIRLHVPDPAALEDVLNEGVEFKFRALPPLMNENDPRSAALHRSRMGNDPLDELARDGFKRKELLAACDEKELERRIPEIFSTARLSLEEGGANTLYLALGFLQWTESDTAEKKHLSPLLLIPVLLTRESVRTGYRIKRHDDETIVNPTLLQMLRDQYGLQLPGLDPLPTDEKGIDVSKVWQTFRTAVREKKGWEVIEHVHLGNFSFQKFLMWKDLADRTNDLKKNRIVAHLIDHPKESYASNGDIRHADDLDDRYKAEQLLTPLSSDSSQLNAIARSAEGYDFVLEGPPGTGKSQTITNLIANALAHGKSVLFVSEKMAALSVVFRRLNQIGLGEFCLELHSSKAKKTDVLQQLRASLDMTKVQSNDEWQRQADRLNKLRHELNSVVRSLHHEHSNGLTIFRAVGEAIRHRDWIPATMEWTDPHIHTRADRDNLQECINQISTLAAELDSLDNHPLSLIGRGDWSHGFQEQLATDISLLFQLTDELERALDAMNTAIGVPHIDGLTLSELQGLDQFADTLLKAPMVPVGVASECVQPATSVCLRELRQVVARRRDRWTPLSEFCRDEVVQLNGVEWLSRWTAAKQSFVMVRWWQLRQLRRQLNAFHRLPGLLSDTQIEQLLAALPDLNQLDQALLNLKPQAQALLQEHYKAQHTDVAALERQENWIKQFLHHSAQIASADQLAESRRRWLVLVGEQRAKLLPSHATGKALISYRDAWRKFLVALKSVEMLTGSAPIAGGEQATAALTNIRATLTLWSNNKTKLRLWCLWRNYRARAIQLGLRPIVAALESGATELRNIGDYYEYSYCVWWAKRMIDRTPALASFASVEHDRKIQEFKLLDDRYRALTRDYLRAKLCSAIPVYTQGAKAPDPELGLLQRELAKQRMHIPVRKLVMNMPKLLPRLKPCLLMSPLSVAQYLDAGFAPFDLVVFDEASQIPVWDAVGAIARGKQLVMVGDPKQLPPTNFFGKSDDEAEPGSEDEEVVIKDLESILDECLGVGLPTLSLNWHYRSKHESLIAFSNQEYYQGRLLTFPSPFTQDIALRYEYVGGVYDRGSTRTNRMEAEAIVSAILAHFRNEHSRHQSLGVVTFNATQQRLIETLLDEQWRAHPVLEDAANKLQEELFIKNLENVQGDERDVIYFSTTFGPDAAGKFPMVFGPLNNEGGERRLNVAITRARIGITVFSSMRPEQIDVSRTRAKGVADLKAFLDFTLRGPKALIERRTYSDHEPDSPFEAEVIAAVRNLGFSVHPQVGCAGFRVDIGVVDPENIGKYLLGIECDGATYHRFKTARDRDRLRQQILEDLGWKLHRIWSTDWWENPQKEIAKIVAAIESAKRKSSSSQLNAEMRMA